jgi:SAM-dependent methyltransferase
MDTAFNPRKLPMPDRAEIDRAVAPYVQARMPVRSPEWRKIAETAEAKEQKIFTRKKWRSLLPWRRNRRPQTLVSSQYENHWAKVAWPRTNNPEPNEKPVICTWDDEGMLIRRYGRKRIHHLCFARLIRELKPQTALEVGCGNGVNLLIMSALFPEIQWHGVELTEAGVAVAQSVQKETELPAVLREFAVDPLVDAAAHTRVNFRQGTAASLPFENKTFDLVFSFQALEQMQSIRDQAVSEMARVTRRFVVCTEPFREFNQAPIQKHYMGARGYLDLGLNELPDFGLKPFLVFSDWPQKMNSGLGLAACELG